MYCPECGKTNTDDTKFCRVCGASLQLVTRALSGALTKNQHNLVLGLFFIGLSLNSMGSSIKGSGPLSSFGIIAGLCIIVYVVVWVGVGFARAKIRKRKPHPATTSLLVSPPPSVTEHTTGELENKPERLTKDF